LPLPNLLASLKSGMSDSLLALASGAMIFLLGVALILRPQCTVRLGNRTTFSGITTVRL
jgi:hypothetical protein